MPQGLPPAIPTPAATPRLRRTRCRPSPRRTAPAPAPGPLFEAGLRAREGDSAAAVKIYDELTQSSKLEPVYRDLATVLSVMHQVQTGDPGQLTARLQPLVADSSPWRHSARELTALLAIRSGDKAAAGRLFTQIQNDPAAPAGVRSRATELAALYSAEPQ